MRSIYGLVLVFFTLLAASSCDVPRPGQATTAAPVTTGTQLSRPVSVEIGVYYYPGWHSVKGHWKDILGLPASLSPGVAWPEREPLLGYYPEEEPGIAQKHLEWASVYGIDFFAYDWYWDGQKSYSEHALRSYLGTADKRGLRFCLLWANHTAVPRSLEEFDGMVEYWLAEFFVDPMYYRIDGKPVVFIFSHDQLQQKADYFGMTHRELLERAEAAARGRGLPGIYFVMATNARPGKSVESNAKEKGYAAYTGWNYVISRDTGRVADYDSMVDTYADFYGSVPVTDRKLPYMVAASPGWDSRPWHADAAVVRENTTPEKFSRMLDHAAALIEKSPYPRVLMVEAWNEFAEGSYIEPTREWGFAYLEALRRCRDKITAQLAANGKLNSAE